MQNILAHLSLFLLIIFLGFCQIKHACIEPVHGCFGRSEASVQPAVSATAKIVSQTSPLADPFWTRIAHLQPTVLLYACACSTKIVLPPQHRDRSYSTTPNATSNLTARRRLQSSAHAAHTHTHTQSCYHMASKRSPPRHQIDVCVLFAFLKEPELLHHGTAAARSSSPRMCKGCY